MGPASQRGCLQLLGGTCLLGMDRASRSPLGDQEGPLLVLALPLGVVNPMEGTQHSALPGVSASSLCPRPWNALCRPVPGVQSGRGRTQSRSLSFGPGTQRQLPSWLLPVCSAQRRLLAWGGNLVVGSF